MIVSFKSVEVVNDFFFSTKKECLDAIAFRYTNATNVTDSHELRI
jgi:hypothetical protein